MSRERRGAQGSPQASGKEDEEVVLVDVFTPRREDFLQRPRPERGAEPPSESERGWGPASTEER
jgi:hypothetical protein